MSLSDDEDKLFARFLDSEISSEEEEEPEPKPKRQCIEKEERNAIEKNGDQKGEDRNVAMTIESGVFGKIPKDLFRNIFKYLSAEDLVSCCLVCKFFNLAASDDCLWRCLYSIRWDLTIELRECSWKKLYINRDKKDTNELVEWCPVDFKEYYIQMQAAKRSQAPLPYQMVDDSISLDKTVLERASLWKKNMGFTDEVATHDHYCSGTICSFHQIGNSFICRETGNVHVCNDNCKEVLFCRDNSELVCPISGKVPRKSLNLDE